MISLARLFVDGPQCVAAELVSNKMTAVFSQCLTARITCTWSIADAVWLVYHCQLLKQSSCVCSKIHDVVSWNLNGQQCQF